jgi:hypothetical protein
MPRIIVTTDQAERRAADRVPVLLDEHVISAHLSDDYGSTQLLERLGWAVRDAEELELASGPSGAPSVSQASYQTAEAVRVAAGNPSSPDFLAAGR